MECVVHFDVFDQAVGAGRKVYGAQKEEQKCFHDEIREREKVVMSVSADSGGACRDEKRSRRARRRWCGKGCFLRRYLAKAKPKFGIKKSPDLLFVAMRGFLSSLTP